jgi:hypothetical protein
MLTGQDSNTREQKSRVNKIMAPWKTQNNPTESSLCRDPLTTILEVRKTVFLRALNVFVDL